MAGGGRGIYGGKEGGSLWQARGPSGVFAGMEEWPGWVAWGESERAGAVAAGALSRSRTCLAAEATRRMVALYPRGYRVGYQLQLRVRFLLRLLVRLLLPLLVGLLFRLPIRLRLTLRLPLRLRLRLMLPLWLRFASCRYRYWYAFKCRYGDFCPYSVYGHSFRCGYCYGYRYGGGYRRRCGYVYGYSLPLRHGYPLRYDMFTERFTARGRRS